MKFKYDIISPDGFSFFPANDLMADTVSGALRKLADMMEGWERQGYYSDQYRNRLTPLEAMKQCDVIELGIIAYEVDGYWRESGEKFEKQIISVDELAMDYYDEDEIFFELAGDDIDSLTDLNGDFVVTSYYPITENPMHL